MLRRLSLAVTLAFALNGQMLFAQSSTVASPAISTAPRLAMTGLGSRPSLVPPQPPVYLDPREHTGHGVAKRALLGAITGMVVAVGGTALWVQHCNQTDHHSEGPPCEIAYVYPGVPVIAGGAMLGAFIGGRWPMGSAALRVR